MSALNLHLAAEIRSARAALDRAGIENRTASEIGHPVWLAANRAADCLADLERAERLLASERASAEAALRGLERAANLFRIAAEQQRRADEAADLAEAEAAAARHMAAVRKVAAVRKKGGAK